MCSEPAMRAPFSGCSGRTPRGRPSGPASRSRRWRFPCGPNGRRLGLSRLSTDPDVPGWDWRARGDARGRGAYSRAGAPGNDDIKTSLYRRLEPGALPPGPPARRSRVDPRPCSRAPHARENPNSIKTLAQLRAAEAEVRAARSTSMQPSRCRAKGPDRALMLVGEQPGDKEDLAGKPFVGPAGAILDQALAEAGIPRDGLRHQCGQALQVRAARQAAAAQAPDAYEIERCTLVARHRARDRQARGHRGAGRHRGAQPHRPHRHDLARCAGHDTRLRDGIAPGVTHPSVAPCAPRTRRTRRANIGTSTSRTFGSSPRCSPITRRDGARRPSF